MFPALATVTVSVLLYLFTGHQKLELPDLQLTASPVAVFRVVPSGAVSPQSMYTVVHTIHATESGEPASMSMLSREVRMAAGNASKLETYYLFVSDNLSVQFTQNASLAAKLTFKSFSGAGLIVDIPHFIQYTRNNTTYMLLACRTGRVESTICLNQYGHKPPKRAVPLITRPYKKHC